MGKLPRYFLFFCILGVLIPSMFVSPSRSYWGAGDNNCLAEHGISSIWGYYSPGTSIKLDGIADEEVWQNISNISPEKNYTMRVPTASDNTTGDFFKSYVNLSFALNETHIFLLAAWNDSTLLDYEDGLLFCWNMSMKNFRANFDMAGMKTDAPGERVDSWKFAYYNRLNVSSGTMIDQCFGDTGWYPSTSESKDVQYGFTYDGFSKYQIEVLRPLRTGDEYDVQFYRGQSFYFTLGAINVIGHEKHAISWLWKVTLEGTEPNSNEIPGIFLITFFLGFIASLAILTIRIRKREMQAR